MLNGLDDIDWRSLEHNYGSAENIPGLLRTAARDEVAFDSNDGLYNQLHHQGGWVCSAATAALPFLLDLIESPIAADRTEHVELIARLACTAAEATPEWVDAGWPEAWATVFPRVRRLIDDPDENVRREVTSALGASRHQPAEAVAALRTRFGREPVAIVRADILKALEDLGDRDGIRVLGDHADPSVAIDAMLRAHALDGTTVDAAELGAVLTALRETTDWDVFRPVHGGDSKALTSTDYVAVVTMLAGHAEAERRLAAVRLATRVLAEGRDCEERLVPPIAALLDDPETRFHALQLLAALAAPYPDRFAAMLDDDTLHGRYVVATVGDAALWALVRTGDARCVPVLRELVADGDRHSRSYSPATHISWLPSIGEMLEQVGAEHVPTLLPAVRARLADGGRDARFDYLATLKSWGVLAAEAGPEVKALLETETGTVARQALDAIAPSEVSAPETADLTDEDPWTRTRAAVRLWRSTGESAEATRVLRGVVAEVLDDGRYGLTVGREALSRLAEMGAGEAAPEARRVLGEERRLSDGGGWRRFVDDDAWRRAAVRILEA
ncbi:HEAT repeat domain-containing protein [Phytomonospora sp. NPDC050363]|uniref:HEAT repeat domain-containing protein n=1 Tax=Phytomonospora sp. NPDC050363 TaxID=3155642 RepID=UPI0033E2C079